VIAEHRFETGPIINFSHTAILDKTPAFVDCLIKNAVEIGLHPTNFSRDGVFNQLVLEKLSTGGGGL
jgi:hypothetical protein